MNVGTVPTVSKLSIGTVPLHINTFEKQLRPMNWFKHFHFVFKRFSIENYVKIFYKVVHHPHAKSDITK